jgi:hypothetical protein
MLVTERPGRMRFVARNGQLSPALVLRAREFNITAKGRTV